MSNAAAPGDGLLYTETGWVTVCPVEGPEGPQGPIGPTGPAGPPGEPGTPGADGDDGSGIVVKGTLSGTATPLPASPSPGDLWLIGTPVPTAAPPSTAGPAAHGDGITWDGTTWINVGPVQGPPGPTGPAGATGATGSTGPAGPTGATGAAGAAGATGPTGPAGDPATNLVTSVAGRQGVVVLTKADVGLSNVDNTSDANKPVSTAQAAANALALPKAGGVMTGDVVITDATAKVTSGAGGNLRLNAPTGQNVRLMVNDQSKLTASDTSVVIAVPTTISDDLTIGGSGFLTVSAGGLVELNCPVNVLGAGNDLTVDGHVYGGVAPTSPNDLTRKDFVDARDLLKADKTTTVTTTAPLTGGGDLSASRTLDISTFTSSVKGAVPASGGGTVNFLRADGTFVPPVAGGGAMYQFTYSNVTTAPPATGVVRLNNTTMASVTQAFVHYMTSDGIDIKQRLTLAATVGTKLYIQDKDDSTRYQIFLVTGAITDNSTYATIPVSFVSGGTAIANSQPMLAGFIYNSTTSSETTSGIVELATAAETLTGTDTTRATHPAGVKAVADTKQPLDADLTAIAALTATTDNFMVSVSSAWASRTPAQVKTTLALENVSNTSDATKDAATATLTNKTLTDPKINLAVNAQTGTTYTLVLADSNKVITCSNAAAVTVTVPPNSSVAFPIGTQLTIVGIGVGLVTVAQGAGVTVNATPSLAFRARYSGASLVKTGTDQWYLLGDLA